MNPVLPRRPALHQWLPLWREYKRTGDPKLRDRLIFTYVPMVKYIVFSKVKEIPARYEISDLVSCGIEALIVSIDRYDETKGATLEQFAWTRIHGRILDELRRLDWAPRSVRRWGRDIREAEERFLMLYKRRPSQEELADALGIELAELRRHQHDVANSSLTSLHSMVFDAEDGAVERIETIAHHDRATDPEQATFTQMAKERLREILETLPERDRKDAVLLYAYGLTMREAGEILEVTESRISQIHSGIKRTIREAIEQQQQDALFYELGAA